MTAYLGIGTNLGNRTENLHNAINLINEQAGTLLACSSFIETEPWGFTSDNPFLNAVVAIATPHAPHQLLHITQSIEKTMGRMHKTRFGKYTDRIIDIDILLYDELIINSPTLTIPHPHLLKREFAYLPLLEIAPHITFPGVKKQISEIVQQCI